MCHSWTKQAELDWQTEPNWVYICQTIIQELDKVMQNNHMGMIPSPISTAVENFNWILFLVFDAKWNRSTLYKEEFHYAHSIPFLACESALLKAIEVFPNSIMISLKGRRKVDLEEIAIQLKLSYVGTVQEMKIHRRPLQENGANVRHSFDELIRHSFPQEW